MSNAWLTALAALGPASILATVLKAALERYRIKAGEDKSKADAAAVIAETAAELLEPLRRELRKTNAELAKTRGELSDTRDELRAVRGHLVVVEGLLREHDIPVPEFRWPRAANSSTQA